MDKFVRYFCKHSFIFGLLKNLDNIFASQVDKIKDFNTSHGNKARGRVDNKEDGDYELSLSLSLPSQGSNGSSTSEMSEAVSYSRSNFKECLGSSTRRYNINLDLSIALCGT